MDPKIEDAAELIAEDTSSLLTSLLVYRLAAKVLAPSEIDITIDGGSDTIIEQLSKHIDKKVVEKVVKDIAENTKDLIHQQIA